MNELSYEEFGRRYREECESTGLDPGREIDIQRVFTALGVLRSWDNEQTEKLNAKRVSEHEQRAGQ